MINIFYVSLDRWFGFKNNAVRVELIIFCDALAQAYGWISWYFVFSKNCYDQNICSLILSKSCLFPFERTVFDYSSKIRISSSHFNSRIKMHYFRGDRLQYSQKQISLYFIIIMFIVNLRLHICHS